MIGFVTTKNKISTIFLVILLVIVLLVLVISKGASASAENENLHSGEYREERIAFIENMGYKVNGNAPEDIKEIEIPNVFSDVYEQYQKIQLEAGFDLKKYSGRKATLYTYNLNYSNRTDVYAHILVSDSVIIGGDISALSVSDGFMKPLKSFD